jgi:hypothetical protein
LSAVELGAWPRRGRGRWRAAAAAASCLGCAATLLASTPAAGAAAGAASFTEPAPGAIELIAIELDVRFKGHPPPLHVRLDVPPAARPDGIGVLAGDRRTELRGHLARYVLLVEALRPLRGATAAGRPHGPPPRPHEPPDPLAKAIRFFEESFGIHVRRRSSLDGLFGGATATVAGDNVVSDLFDTSQQAREALERALASDGASNLDVSEFGTGAYDDGHTFGWKRRGEEAVADTWNKSWTSLSLPPEALDSIIAEIEQQLQEEFEDAVPQSAPPPAPTPPAAKQPITWGSNLAASAGALLGSFAADVQYWFGRIAAALTGHAAQAGEVTPSATAPVAGTVTSITLKGYAIEGDEPGPGGSEPIRFSVDRPKPGGQLEVLTTTTPPFALPGTPGTYTFDMSQVSFPCCKVEPGDVVSLDARGGEFAVFGSVPGSETDSFSMGGTLQDPGSLWTGTPHENVELLMQVTEQPG